MSTALNTSAPSTPVRRPISAKMRPTSPRGTIPAPTTIFRNLVQGAAQPATTKGQAGHRHPGSTYAYVVKGEVVSRLGDGPDKHYKAGEAWSATPGQAHYIVNASATEPARLVVVMVTPKAATALSEPLK